MRALIPQNLRSLPVWLGVAVWRTLLLSPATFAVAEHFGMERISLLFSFDNPLLDAHILATGEEVQARRAVGDRALLEITLRLLCINAGCGQTQSKP